MLILINLALIAAIVLLAVKLARLFLTAQVHEVKPQAKPTIAPNAQQNKAKYYSAVRRADKLHAASLTRDDIL